MPKKPTKKFLAKYRCNKNHSGNTTLYNDSLTPNGYVVRCYGCGQYYTLEQLERTAKLND